MLILMRHAKHGQMYVHSLYDMEQAQAQGWEKAPSKDVAAAVAPAGSEPAAVAVSPKRKSTKREK